MSAHLFPAEPVFTDGVSTYPWAEVWQGRTDPQEGEDGLRWHHVIRPYTALSPSAYTLCGFSVDEGVARNQGRRGAAGGPLALRRALGNLPAPPSTSLADAGDVACPDGNLEDAQTLHAARITALLRAGSHPLVLGGGHEVAWGTYQGIAEYLWGPRGDNAPSPNAARTQAGTVAPHPVEAPDAGPSRSPHDSRSLPRLLVLNVDAHFDLRQDLHPTSGTPFLQALNDAGARNAPCTYAVFGISTFANTRALFRRAEAHGVPYVLDEVLQHEAHLDAALSRLRTLCAAADAVYLSLCLDVLPAATAPGVSAPNPFGVPLWLIEELLREVIRSDKVVVTEIAELNPRWDVDGRTARVGARCVGGWVRR